MKVGNRKWSQELWSAEDQKGQRQGVKARFLQCHFLLVVLISQLRNSLDVMGAARLRVENQGSAESVNFIKEISPHRHAALSKCMSGLFCNQFT